MTNPGTWHDSAPTRKVDWPVAVAAWTQATEVILEHVAAEYGATITYEQLRERVFDATGYRTRMLPHQWARQVLGPLQAATLTGGKPPLSALVVRVGAKGVGDGYVNHEHPAGFDSSVERQRAAAADRLTCYRAYCDDVPDDAATQMTELYTTKEAGRPQLEPRARRPAAPTPPSPPRTCTTCWTALPASGRCDFCD
ncbi:hypothetical protein [Blastococcus sp. SYSU DS1024]